MVPWLQSESCLRCPWALLTTPQGSIERVDQDRYKVSGVWEKVDDKTLVITELPVRKWTQDFKEMLEEMTTGTDKVPATVKACVFLFAENCR